MGQSVTFNFTAGYYQTSTSDITDAPRFGWRGLLIDTSRHYQSVRSIERVLESMAIAKLNVLHWHIVDTQSFPFTSRAYPKLQNGAFDAYQRFSLNDVADIVAFAQQRGIRVVPEFDIPGHTMSWCVGYPEICPDPKCNSPDGENDSPDGILNPANNFTYELIEGLLNEAGDVFTDEYVHIGGDETQTSCWDKTDEITALMKTTRCCILIRGRLKLSMRSSQRRRKQCNGMRCSRSSPITSVLRRRLSKCGTARI